MIYYVCGSPDPIFFGLDGNCNILLKHHRCVVRKNELTIQLADQKSVENNRFFKINQKKYTLVSEVSAYKFEDAKSGKMYLADDVGRRIDCQPEILYLLYRAMPRMVRNNLVIGGIRRYKESRRSSFFVANITDNKFDYRKDFSLLSVTLEDDGIYGCNLKTDSLVKITTDLKDVWSFSPGFGIGGHIKPMVYADLVLHYHGAARSEIVKEIQHREPIYGAEYLQPIGVALDGKLYGICRETGEQRWCRKFHYGLVDMALHKGAIFCAAENEFYRIEPETGEIVNSVKLKYNTGGQTEREKVLNIIKDKLWVTINYMPDNEFCILVLNPDSFDIEHKIDLPAPYVAEDLLYFDNETSQVYYRLRHRRGEYRVWNDKQLLVLDANNLSSPVELEPLPNITTELKPASDNPNLEELWIYIKDTPLDKAIRFGLIETQNQTTIYAETNMFNRGCRKTFNGRVHFRYSGSDKPAQEVREKLKIIEDEFACLAKDMEAGDGSGQPVSLDVEYLE